MIPVSSSAGGGIKLYNSIFWMNTVSPFATPHGPRIPILAMESLKDPAAGAAVRSTVAVWNVVVFAASLSKLNVAN